MSTVTLHDVVHVIDACNADLATSVFDDVRLAGSTFTGVTFAGAEFTDVLFDGCSLSRVSFVGVNIDSGQCEGLTIDGIEVKALLNAYRAATARPQCEPSAKREQGTP